LELLAVAATLKFKLNIKQEKSKLSILLKINNTPRTAKLLKSTNWEEGQSQES